MPSKYSHKDHCIIGSWWYSIIVIYIAVKYHYLFTDDCETPTETPYVWLGDTTSECDLTASYCDLFGLDFECEAEYGRLHTCDAGNNVLCVSPQMSLWDPTPVTTLKVLAYNIWELRYLYYQSGQYERTCRIPQKIFELYGDVDVIVFNEAFMGGCFTQNYFPLEISLPGPPLFQRDGGQCSFQQMLTQYGFEYFTDILGQESRRVIPRLENVIYAGDLNTELNDANIRWDQMLRILEADMPEIVGDLNITYDYENNDVRGEDETQTGGKWIDYVLYSNQHIMPNSATQEAIKFVADEPFPVCMRALPIQRVEDPDGIIPIEGGQHRYPYQDECLDWWNITDLSDHYAVLGTFDFSSPIQPDTIATAAPLPDECIDDRPQVWLGRATFECDLLTPDYCGMFGLEYVCSADFQVWDKCYFSTAKNVLCAVPEITLSEPTPATTFKTLAYNVYELRLLYYQSGQRERTCRILTQIFTRHGDVDAIIFNEAFMGGCFPQHGASFRQIMEYYGFSYYTGTVGETLSKPPENGGVFIASRWPILHWDKRVYENTIVLTDDWMSAKGAIYAEIEKTVDGKTRKYHVLGTHLHAGDGARGGDEVRLNQSIEMHELMLRQNVPTDEAVIYGGDFNTDYYTDQDWLKRMLDALESIVPEPVGYINVTSDDEYNNIKTDPRDIEVGDDPDWVPGSWIDYVVYSYSHLVPVTSSQESVKYVADTPFTVCMDDVRPFGVHFYPYSSKCRQNQTITDLSDHYAVLGRFEYAVDDPPLVEAMSFTMPNIMITLIFSVFSILNVY
ncbi:uncharacterized protein LOC102808101 [Saccoglossus kowalevskii]|uniref:sphingomyelin phosphodiesterase n=1 Tax=Saccoglossus kowalevskii TaxID=10224 RepID=A0ABM0MG19_SACKO|nr:PREDICTED: uncharacterized protein LOC102808101 [Saccoglossus kowalevskii]